MLTVCMYAVFVSHFCSYNMLYAYAFRTSTTQLAKANRFTKLYLVLVLSAVV